MLEVGAVTTERFIGSIEERGVDGIKSVFAPAPVRLIALIVALITKGLLIRPDVIPMPSEEVASGVDEQSVVQVGSDEIIEATANAGDDASRCSRRLFLKAKHSIDIIKAFLAREGRPNVLAHLIQWNTIGMDRFIPFTSNDGVFQCAVACRRVAAGPFFEFGEALSGDGIYFIAAVTSIFSMVDIRPNYSDGKEGGHKKIGGVGQHSGREEVNR